MSTKEILYRVECDKIFEEIAQMVGLKINEVIDIELDKKMLLHVQGLQISIMNVL